jgi:ubiquinone/menaquinone biosynthesis C-methylase UbiE
MNQIEKTKEFYNNYGTREWERLDKTPYDRLNFLLHMDFINEYLEQNIKIFDVGCGAGRFSLEFAKIGCNVSLLDISEEQIRLAQEKFEEYGLSNKLEVASVGNVADMKNVSDNTYDITVCYGAPLNYLYDNYAKGIKELYRVTKPGGHTFISVNSRFGVIRTLMGMDKFDITDFLSKPDYWYINDVVKNGNLPEHPQVSHPPRHMFEANELKRIFNEVGFNNIEMGSSPCLIAGLRDRAEEIYENDKAWETLIKLELNAYRRSTTLDLGEFLMIRGTK